MKSIKISAAILFSTTLFSCGNSENKQQNDNGINIDAVTSSHSNDRDAKGDNKCLLEFQSKYDDLLSESDVLAATGFTKDAMDTKYNKVLKNPENHEFVYKFKNGRTGNIPGIKREMAVPDLIAIRSIKPMSLTTFNQSYQVATDEQVQAANNAINDIAEGNASGSEAEKAFEHSKSQGVDKEQIKKTGGNLTGAFQQVTKGYRIVEGIGNAACWNIVTNELYVLQNGVKFEIRADISNDTEKNKSAAIKLAEIVLNKCK